MSEEHKDIPWDKMKGVYFLTPEEAKAKAETILNLIECENTDKLDIGKIRYIDVRGLKKMANPVEPTRDIASGMVSLVLIAILLALSLALYTQMPNWWLKFLAFIPLSIAAVGVGAAYEEFRLKVREPKEK